tara:strand:+ start:174 stop:1688 length:1515 start_codon:yes stop_codon:yes gene_type:complete
MDEMNIFAVSSQIARAEAVSLMHVSKHKDAVHLIHDSKLGVYLKGESLDARDDNGRHKVLGWMRHLGFSIGWDDVISGGVGGSSILCKTTENVHNVKNRAMSMVKEKEPLGSPWRAMIEAKSKGNWSNVCAIKAMLGQQFLNGNIPDRLHSWEGVTRENTGFISSSYRTGLSEKEFFFHCMAGREGLIGTAIRTADAGYTHRKIARSLEDVRMYHDGSLRDEYRDVIAFAGAPSTTLSEAGAFVGIDAAQHIGEPATQLTLNTFHSSGSINEITTSGLKRLNEILQWSKKQSIKLTSLGPKFQSLRASWVLRNTTLRTFTVERRGEIIDVDGDTLLLYDTDINYVANQCGGTVTGPLQLRTTAESSVHITGIPNVIAVNNGVALHTGILPRQLNGSPNTPRDVLKLYGIEAARSAYINELKRVLPQVNSVYIEVLADSVTYTGTPMSLDHSSFKRFSTFKAASFERAQTVIPAAARFSRVDPLVGVSEKLAFHDLHSLEMSTFY